MPARYEAMRDKFLQEGMSEKAAKTKAAKIYNATKKEGEPSLHHTESQYRESRVKRGMKKAFYK